MVVFARVLRLLSIVVWVGGLIFFAFVLAPVAFHVLPSTHQAGMVVAGTLGILNDKIGLVCGLIFMLATPWRIRSRVSARLLLAEVVCVAGMMAATMVVQWGIVPRMERDRIAAGGDVDAAPLDNSARLDFERLHPISEKVEGAALLLGLGVVVLMGFEDGAAPATEPA
jgi:uncharacterized membrane protein